MRHLATYCITGSPTNAVKRAANADRDYAEKTAATGVWHQDATPMRAAARSTAFAERLGEVLAGA
jgi:hypothetical protein